LAGFFLLYIDLTVKNVLGSVQLKRFVNRKIKILSLFIHPYVKDFHSSSEHKWRHFNEIWDFTPSIDNPHNYHIVASKSS